MNYSDVQNLGLKMRPIERKEFNKELELFVNCKTYDDLTHHRNNMLTILTYHLISNTITMQEHYSLAEWVIYHDPCHAYFSLQKL